MACPRRKAVRAARAATQPGRRSSAIRPSAARRGNPILYIPAAVTTSSTSLAMIQARSTSMTVALVPWWRSQAGGILGRFAWRVRRPDSFNPTASSTDRPGPRPSAWPTRDPRVARRTEMVVGARGARGRGSGDGLCERAGLSGRQRIRARGAKTTNYGRGCCVSTMKGRALALGRPPDDWHPRCTFWSRSEWRSSHEPQHAVPSLRRR
jgi:hypothetical protein